MISFVAEQPPYQAGSPSALALELFELRRAALVERVALDVHDAIAAEGASFAGAREAAGAWVDAVEAAIAGRYAPSAVSVINRHALASLDAGISLGAVMAGVHAATGAMVALVGEHEPRAVPPVARAAGGIGGEVAATAGRSLEERARMQLKRRADRADRFREAAGAVTAAALDAGGVLQTLARAATATLDCDWAAIALREGDGRLAITALEGRGAGWAQRWSLTEREGFAARVLSGGQAVAVTDPVVMGYAGADPPAAVVGAPLRAPGGDSAGLLFAGRDHGLVPDDDDASLAAALAEVGARALETAQRYRDSMRAAGQLEILADAVRQATAGAEQTALALVARAACEATGSEVALIRVVEEAGGDLVTRGVHARSAALAAELEGTRVSSGDPAIARLLGGEELLADALTDQAVAQPIAERLGPVEALGLPIVIDGAAQAVLLVARSTSRYGPDDVRRARSSVAHAAMLVVLDRVRRHALLGAASAQAEAERLGEALAAGSDEPRLARLLARLAAEALGAARSLLYRGSGGDDLELIAGYGFRRDELAAAPGRALAIDAVSRSEPVVTGGEAAGVAALAGSADLPTVVSASIIHDGAPVGVLQLFYTDRDAAVAARAAFGHLAGPAAEALYRAAEGRRRDEDLRRMTALVEIAAQATASASLEQTLAAVGAHLQTLAPGAQAGVYVIDEGRPVLSEPPAAVAAVQAAAVASLLRDDPNAAHILVPDVVGDERLGPVAAEIAEIGVRSLLVVPLRFRETVMGALSLSARELAAFGDREIDLLRRQAPPIVLALESALLAGHSNRLEQELSSALASERRARGELDAQDTVVRAVAEGWDRQRASAAVARSAAELLDADAAGVLVLRDESQLAVESLYVASPALDEPVRRIVRRAPSFIPSETLAELASGRSVIIEGGRLKEGSTLLGPLLAPGASAGLVPLRPEQELRAVLVVVSLDPARPIGPEHLDRAERFATQAALAVR
jgi:GAF domain-containing protein